MDHTINKPMVKSANYNVVSGSAPVATFQIRYEKVSHLQQVENSDLRYGSTKRVTNLRKSDQDQLWDGVVQRE